MTSITRTRRPPATAPAMMGTLLAALEEASAEAARERWIGKLISTINPIKIPAMVVEVVDVGEDLKVTAEIILAVVVDVVLVVVVLVVVVVVLVVVVVVVVEVVVVTQLGSNSTK
jgi:hypothetical protein